MMQMHVESLRNALRLSLSRRLVVYTVGLGLWLTGAAWLVLHYFFTRKTEFGPAPHPLEYWSRAVHGLFGFASLWTFGLLWGVHVVGGWKTGRQRVSGTLAFAVLVWLGGSGYLLYYLGSDELISSVSLLHWAVGLILPVPFVVHRFVRVPRGTASLL